MSKSATNQIYVQWTAVTGTNAPGENILGYRLYMAEDTSGVYKLIYDG